MLIYQRKNKKPERYLNGQYHKDMPAHLFFIGFLLPGDGQAKAAYKIIHYIALKGEGGKTQKSQDRHLKEFYVSHKGNRIYPFGFCPKVPEFPQQAAYHAGDQELNGFLRSSFREVLK